MTTLTLFCMMMAVRKTAAVAAIVLLLVAPASALGPFAVLSRDSGPPRPKGRVDARFTLYRACKTDAKCRLLCARKHRAPTSKRSFARVHSILQSCAMLLKQKHALSGIIYPGQ